MRFPSRPLLSPSKTCLTPSSSNINNNSNSNSKSATTTQPWRCRSLPRPQDLVIRRRCCFVEIDPHHPGRRRATPVFIIRIFITLAPLVIDPKGCRVPNRLMDPMPLSSTALWTSSTPILLSNSSSSSNNSNNNLNNKKRRSIEDGVRDVSCACKRSKSWRNRRSRGGSKRPCNNARERCSCWLQRQHLLRAEKEENKEQGTKIMMIKTWTTKNGT
mmetsp:Transcript_705/g.875  ORF Transcript_705/g.875 Transcript_705/m.875 type:complete len:216 (-) Transcript_705:147-794(-)